MLLIRQYQAKDNESVKTLHYAGVKQFNVGAGTEADLFLDADLDDIENVYLRNRGEFLVGIYEEKLVAMGALKKLSKTRGEIKRMRVHPEYQRRGFGQTFLLKLLEIATQLGYTELCLDTLVQNIPAQKLYEKFGFVQVGRKKLGHWDLIFYERQLNC